MHLLIVFLFAVAAANLASAVGTEPTPMASQEPEPQASSYNFEYLASQCPDGIPGQFSVCAEEVVPGGDSAGGSSQIPMRECRYFANGTIDVPTMTVITAWIPVGSRLCIGDELPKPSGASGGQMSAEEIEIRDRFTALAQKPVAWRSPASDVEFEDEVEFHVEAITLVVTGTLLGRPAQVRFRPVAASWEISNGQSFSGFSRTFAFPSPGNFWAKAQVLYEVDYKYSTANWVFKATQWELESNKLTIAVIERERRTLLVG